ncbi:EamA family transporter [Ochrovirga pacifica]|uniref:EamA family transporter n=1 Tax=Ochrovirga pacifica TaxID=1042376 RepID=UPI000255921D|nr:EamA family transporter [Ochrovirga pacifica]
MIYLFLSVLFTVLVFVILKEFNRFGLDNLQAIVVSYFTALLIGIGFSETPMTFSFLLSKPWIYGAMAISTLFIIVFNLMAITAQKGGLSVMTIANKMSMSIPILAGVLLYDEQLGVLKIAGILLAFLGLWFACKKAEAHKFDKRLWYLPFFIFIGAGLADTLLNHMQTQYVPVHEFDVFSTSLFLFCGLLGLLVFFVKWSMGKLKLHPKSWIGGLALGFPNYFSIYYIVKALSQKEFDAAFVFSANNLLVVLISVLIGLWLYKEKLNVQNYIGLGLSCIAIILLYFAL